MYEFLILSRDKFKNTLLGPLREVHSSVLVINQKKQNIAKN